MPAGVDISGDSASVAFVRSRWDEPTAWYPADIVTDATRYGDSRPRLRILIGPENGGVALATGTWHILGKIVDTPEIPVKYLDYIVIR